MREPGRGYTRWRLILPFLAVPVLVLGFLIVGLFMWALSDDEYPRSGALKNVTCAEALAFGGASPPTNAPAARTDASCGALRLDVSHEDGLPATAEAHVVQLRVEYEDGNENAENALVWFSAFTM
ncbi:hypothetical protein ABT373_23430 [Streptomyces sp. NPDC000070]|uniref:hypothetical protein n=1 Tax=Streptomyces sp. NPDC000070 TaxID=3154240 RepID=UPI00332ADAED